MLSITQRDEWRNVLLTELESIKGPYGIGVERDLYTRQKRISEYIGK